MGIDILRYALRAKELMGMVPEISNAYVDLTVWENLMLMGKLYGLPKDIRERRAENLLNQLNLYDRRKQKVKNCLKD